MLVKFTTSFTPPSYQQFKLQSCRKCQNGLPIHTQLCSKKAVREVYCLVLFASKTVLLQLFILYLVLFVTVCAFPK
jgi:hypothetical protein